MRAPVILLAPLLALAFDLHAQQATNVTSGQWVPDESTNAALLKQAGEDAARRGPPPEGARPPAGKPDGGPPPGSMGGGGMGGGGHGGPPPGGGRPPQGKRGAPNVSGLLPGEAAFAAPEHDTLLLQRMSESVVFAMPGSEATVIVPMHGNTELGNGVTASISDGAHGLVLQVDAPDGRRVSYRYSVTANGNLQVDINISGDRIPGGGANLRRTYRRMNVDVSAPQQAKD